MSWWLIGTGIAVVVAFSIGWGMGVLEVRREREASQRDRMLFP